MTRLVSNTKAGAAAPAQTDSSICLLVVAMHRSGTSALTRALSLLGADLPRTLMQENEAHKASNATGHWESEPLARLGDLILDSAGTDWRSPEAVSASWYRSPRYADMRSRAVAMLEEEFGGSPLFVFKDPRVCKLLPFWLDVLDRFGATPKIISIVRSPAEVSASLNARNEIASALGDLIWLRYVLDAEAGSRDISRLFVTYDQLLENAGELTARIGAAFDLSWPRSSTRTEKAIADFLSSKHRHHVIGHTPEITGGEQNIASWVNDSYGILTHWARDGETMADRARLDRVRGELDSALALFGKPIHLALTQTVEIRGLRRRIAERDAQLAAGEAQLRTRDQTIERSERLAAESRQALAALEAESQQALAALEKARGEASAAHHQAEIKLARVEERLLTQEASLNDVRKLERLSENALAQARTQLSDLKAKLAERTRVADDRQAAIEHLREDRARRLAERDSRNERMQTRIKTLEEHTALLSEQWRQQPHRETLPSRIARFMRLGNAAAAARAARLAMLRQTELFDPSWYLEKYGDVRMEGIDPAEHYLDHGGLEGRAPGPDFDGRWYLETHRDVCDAGINPLIHYLEHGRLEGRATRSLTAKKATKAGYFPHESPPPSRSSSLADRDGHLAPAVLAERLAARTDREWKGRAVSFRTLTQYLDPQPESAGEAGADPLGTVMVGGVSVAHPVPDGLSGETDRYAACNWLDRLGRLGPFGKIAPAAYPAEPLAHAIRFVFCDDQLILSDAWFHSGNTLRLRFAKLAGSGALHIRIFQHGADNRLSLCGASILRGNGLSFVDAPLWNGFRPILLVVVDDSGALLDSGLLAFPSLCRGGLHYGELGACPDNGSMLTAMRALSLNLLNNHMATVTEGQPLAISKIRVDATGANGSEPAFAPALLDWLVNDLGLILEPSAPRIEGPADAALAAALSVAGAPAHMREQTACLVLPSDAAPTLAALFAPLGSLSGEISRSVEMDEADSLPFYDIAHELTDAAPIFSAVPNFSEPPHVVGATAPAPFATTPALALRWPARVTTPAQILFPVGPQIILDPAGQPPEERKLSVLIDCREGAAPLLSLLSALHQLTGRFSLDCIVIIDPATAPMAIAVKNYPIPFRIIETSHSRPLDRFSEASHSAIHDRLLLLTDSIVLHDPRIGAVLWEACKADDVGSVTCALVSEISRTKNNPYYRQTVGWVGMADRTASFLAKPDLGGAALPMLVPIAGPDIRCTMIDKALFQKHAAAVGDELAFGLSLLSDGRSNLCVRFVTATLVGEAAEDDKVHDLAIPERILQIRRFRR